MGTIRLITRRLPAREIVADQIVTACSSTLNMVISEQVDILQELGQTSKGRDALAETLASQCYWRSGLASFPRRILQGVMSEHDLQALFVAWMRQVTRAQLLEQCIQILKQRPEIPYAKPADPPNPVSEVPSAHGPGGGRTIRVRTRRDPRRTGRCDDRAMSDDGVPA